MAGVLGQWSNGPIQFNSNTGGIEGRGTIDQPPPSAINPTPITAGAPDGGGSLFNGETPGQGALTMNSGSSYAMSEDDSSGGHSSIGTFPSAGGYGSAQTAGDGSGVQPAASFDDGGEVDDEDDGTGAQGAQSATIDPMQAIKATLSYGRKKFGLPQNFSTGDQEQSYADGGEVDEGGGVIPDPTQEQSNGNDVTAGGNKAADPRQTMMYLTGTGNVSPDIAGALEQHIDPQGQMDPTERTMKAISAAPTPDSSFGLMQHYRTKFNAYSAGAKAALDQGNLAQAASHATQAYGNLPSGYSVKFAPAPGGIAVSSRKLGGQPKGYSGGGIVDNEDLPESENIEDRRNETDEGWEAKNDGPTPEGAGTGAIQAYADSQKKTKQPGDDDEGVVKKVKSFDDGGEVDDDDTVQPPVDNQDEGVLQMEQPQAPADEQAEPPADAEDQSAGEDQGGQPQILTPEQFKRLMDSGYDKPLDDGVPSVLGNVLGPLVKGDFAGAAQGIKQNVGNLFTQPGPSPEQSAALASDDEGAMNATQTPGQPEGGQAQAAEAPPPVPTPQPRPPEAGQGDAPVPVPQPRPAGAQQLAPPGVGPQQSTVAKDAAPKGDRLTTADGDKVPVTDEDKARWRSKIDPGVVRQQNYDTQLKRATDLANKLFPWASGENQRAAYIEKAMQTHQVQEGQQDLEHTKGKAALEQGKQTAAMQRELFKQDAINHRNENSVGQKREASDKGIASRERNVDVQQLNAKLRTDMINFPRATLAERAARLGTSPQALAQAAGPSRPHQGGGQQGGGGGSSNGSPSIKFYKGQWYSRGPNGEAVPVAAPR